MQAPSPNISEGTTQSENRNTWSKSQSNKMFWCLLPPNFGPKLPSKARNRGKADFATKVHKSSINHVNVNHEQKFWIWGGTFESNLKNVWRAYLRILETTKCITRQINLIVCKGAHFIQIHCFKGVHSTLSDIQFEGHIWGFYSGHILNPKNAKSRHLPDLRQKRVCYQSNVPPQTAMCPLPWEPWETLLRTGDQGS